MKKIEKLTKEQEARFPEFIDKWTKIGLSTLPADRPRAEAAIIEMYKQGGLVPPKKIVWCGSPVSSGLVRAIILDKKIMKNGEASVWASVRASVWASVWDSVGASVRDSVGASVGASVRDSVGASVWASVRDAVRNSVGASVRDSVGASVRDSVGASVWDSVGASVWASVWDSVRNSVRNSVRASVGDAVWASVGNSVRNSVRDSVGDTVGDAVWASVGDAVYGQHDAAWIAFYRYFFEVISLANQTEKLSGLWELSQSAGWAIPHQNICWVSERHHLLARDERGRLHSLAGPACAYPDGWAIYAVHGVRVPAFIIEKPSEIDVKKIDAEQNAEIRRVMVDRYRTGQEITGAAAYIRDAGGKRLDHDESFGTLWRREINNDEPIVMLEVVNSTREPDGHFKKYFLRVPPTMTKAHDAVAWTFGKTPKEYKPVVET